MKRTALLAVLLIALVVSFAGSAAAWVDPLTSQRILTTLNQDGTLEPKPLTYFTWFDDFFELNADGANNAGWIVNEDSTASTEVITDAAGGVLLITTTAYDGTGAQAQWNAEIVNPNTSKDVIYEVRIKLSDEAQTACLVGLFNTDTTVLDVGDSLGATPTYGIGFYKADGDSEWYGAVLDTLGIADAGYTQTGLGVYASDDTYHVLRFEWNSNTGDLKFKVDGVTVETLEDATYNPNTELTPTIAFDAGSNNARTCSVDYMWVRSDR